MKTAEELTKEILSCADNISLCESIVRDAMFDAWRQGMSEAANIVGPWSDAAHLIKHEMRKVKSL